MTASSVCAAVGVNKDPARGAFFLPSGYIAFSGASTSSLGANSTVLANAAPGQLGDHGLYKGCSGPNLHQVDMNFVKKTKLTERVTFEIRAEMFNIFNHANFGLASATANINNAGFGALVNTNLTAREIQFNGRISF